MLSNRNNPRRLQSGIKTGVTTMKHLPFIEYLPFVVLAVVFFGVATYVGGGQIGAVGKSLPRCDSDFGKSELKRVWDNSPSGRAWGLSIVKIKDTTTESETDTETVCSAHVLWNSGTEQELGYRFTRDGISYLINSKPKNAVQP
jgi:hypothetical protein